MKLSDLPSDAIQHIFRVALSLQINAINECTNIQDFTLLCTRPLPYPTFNLPLTSRHFHKEFQKFRNHQTSIFKRLYFRCSPLMPVLKAVNYDAPCRYECDNYIMLLKENINNAYTPLRIVNSILYEDCSMKLLRAAANYPETIFSVHSVFGTQYRFETYVEEGFRDDYVGGIISRYRHLRRLEMYLPSPAVINDLRRLQSTSLRTLVLQDVKAESIGDLCMFLKENGRHQLSEVSITRLLTDHEASQYNYYSEMPYSYLFYSANPKTCDLTSDDVGQIAAHNLILESHIRAPFVHVGKASYSPGKVHIPKQFNYKKMIVKPENVGSEYSWEKRNRYYCEPIQYFASFDKIGKGYNGSVISVYTRSWNTWECMENDSIPSTFKKDSSKRGIISVGTNCGRCKLESTMPLAGKECKLVSVQTCLNLVLDQMERTANGTVSEERKKLHRNQLDNIEEIIIDSRALCSIHMPILASVLRNKSLICQMNSSAASSACLKNLISFFKEVKHVHTLKISMFALLEFTHNGSLEQVFELLSELQVLCINGHPFDFDSFPREYEPKKMSHTQSIKYSSRMIMKLAECLKKHLGTSLRVILWHDDKNIAAEYLPLELNCTELRYAISSMQKLAAENRVDTSAVVSILQHLTKS